MMFPTVTLAWLLVVMSPNGPVVVDRLASRDSCFDMAEHLYSNHPTHTGKCIGVVGTKAPL